MKIDFLISKMSDGGAQRVVSLLANYLDEAGYKVRIISFTNGDHYPLNGSIERIRLHQQPLLKSVIFSGFFSLLKFYWKKSNRPDLMSSHIDLLGYLTIPIAKIFRIKIIVSEHNNHLSRYTYQEKILWNFLYPLANAVTVLTSFDLPYFQRKNKNTLIMPNPYSFSTHNCNKSQRKKEIMAIGNLNRVHHKGFDNLIRIAEKLYKTHPDWKFTIVGAGTTGKPELEKLINELGLDGHISFLGYREDVKELLMQTGIYILCSRFEGLPMTLLEAMSQGVPCISYNCISGPSDVIDNGKTGLLIEDQNIEDMVKGLNYLIENPEIRDEFSKRAPKSLEKFSLSNVGLKWKTLISEVCS